MELHKCDSATTTAEAMAITTAQNKAPGNLKTEERGSYAAFTWNFETAQKIVAPVANG